MERFVNEVKKIMWKKQFSAVKNRSEMRLNN
jgi:hypothetical protein